MVDVILKEGQQLGNDLLLSHQKIAISEVILHYVPQDQQSLFHTIETVPFGNDS